MFLEIKYFATEFLIPNDPVYRHVRTHPAGKRRICRDSRVLLAPASATIVDSSGK